MYWIPAIFILVEMLYIYYVDKLISYANATALYKKYKDENLASYIKNMHEDSIILYFIIGIFLFLEVIYFIIGLFFPFWLISAIFLGCYIILIIIYKFENVSTSKIIKLANLKNFTTTDIKFDRLLKLNEIKQNDKKIYKLKNYLFSIIKIITFAAIIITHYNSIEIKSLNPIGYYEETVRLGSTENDTKSSDYKCLVYIKELDKYSNGLSKIQFENVEIVSGFDSSLYDHVKNIIKKRFISTRKTTNIEWLKSKK